MIKLYENVIDVIYVYKRNIMVVTNKKIPNKSDTKRKITRYDENDVLFSEN